VPVFVIPCIAVRPEALPLGPQASVYGSILPANDQIAEVGLIPVAHTIGDDFKPGPRLPLESVLHRETW